jgi:hypothetical protein
VIKYNISIIIAINSKLVTIPPARQLAPALGGYLLATRLSGWIYDHHAAAQGSTTTCTGTACYHDTFLVLSVLCALSTTASLCLWWSTRGVYQRIAWLMRVGSSDGCEPNEM